MADHREPGWFVKARQEGRLVVKEPPRFDLDAYLANYKGKTRYERLFHIGCHSSYLYLEALKGAITEAKQGKDVGRYQIAVATLQEIAPNDPDASVDLVWVDKANKQIKAETDRLEAELKGYKNNLIKESIRACYDMGYDDLGQHYHGTGDLDSSTKAFSKMRDFCTTPAHISIMSLRIIDASVAQANWLAVQSNAQKILNLNHKPAELEKIRPKMSAAIGLAQMCSGNYKTAAIHFLETDPRMIAPKPEDLLEESLFNEIMTPNDIAVYGGLCALASMDRNELRRHVLENSNFRNYLELEPHIRRAISSFVSSKYSSCLSILDSYKPDYLLDLHLHSHIPELYFQVRSKSIVQYFIPFSCVTLDSLASAFATNEGNFDDELIDMIERGILQARIDLQQRVLLAKRIDDRSKVLEDALAVSKDYERTAKLRILRLEMLNAGLEVKSSKEQATIQSHRNMREGFQQGGGGLRSGRAFG